MAHDDEDELTELIDNLRDLARASSLDVWPNIMLEDVIEWEAADFVLAVRPILLGLVQRGGELGEKAAALLAGRWAKTSDICGE